MKLDKLIIKNFRGLEDIQLNNMKTSTAIVIAGPNAVGKTTILEAIRLLKVVLSPSYGEDIAQALRDMGIMPPGQNVIEINSIARNFKIPIEITTSFILNSNEVAYLKDNLEQWAKQRLAGTLGISPNDMDTKLIQYLSSDAGQKSLDMTKTEIENDLEKLSLTFKITPSLVIHPNNGSLRGRKIFDQEALGLLSQKSSGYYGLLNYFPADRAMPGGEIPIQLGSNDFVSHMRSHICTPKNKYNRLKNYLVSRLFLGDEQRRELEDDFALVFNELLQGKRLNSLHLTELGGFKVLIEETDSGVIYDIDRMSSGEKALLLTLFLMKRTTASDGLILIDEPELHLNTSVCKTLLPFLVNKVLKPLNSQAIICTHSEEILASAFDSNDCDLFHLRTSQDISRIEIQDREEVSFALEALGSNNIDILFTKGTLYVEGVDDELIFKTGYSEKIQGFKIISLGGRNNIEQHIKELQKAEKQNKLDSKHFFIFDHDNYPTNLDSTELVKVKQWDRYCLENYLLDPSALYDVIKKFNQDDINFSRGNIQKIVEEYALKQVHYQVCKSVYEELSCDNPGFRIKQHKNTDNYNESAIILAERLEKIKEQLEKFNKSDWIKDFIQKCEIKNEGMRDKWATDWESLSNGKEVLKQIYQHYKIKMSISDFKKDIIQEMKKRQSENWKLVQSKLNEALK